MWILAFGLKQSASPINIAQLRSKEDRVWSCSSLCLMDFCGVFELRWKDTSLLSLSFTSVMQKGFRIVSGFLSFHLHLYFSTVCSAAVHQCKRLLLSVSLSLYGVMFHRNCHSPPLPFSFLRNLFVLFWLALLSSPRASSWLDLIVIAHAVIMLYYWHSMVNLGKTFPPFWFTL